MATGSQGLQGDETAGRKHVNDKILKMNTDEMRTVATQLHDKATAISLHRLPLIEARSKVSSEKAAFQSQWEPDVKYEEPHAKWQSNSQHYDSRLDEITQEMNEKASALVWIADHFDAAEAENKRKMSEVNTDIGAPAPSEKPAAPSPKPAAPVPGSKPDLWET